MQMLNQCQETLEFASNEHLAEDPVYADEQYNNQ